MTMTVVANDIIIVDVASDCELSNLEKRLSVSAIILE